MGERIDLDDISRERLRTDWQDAQERADMGSPWVLRSRNMPKVMAVLVLLLGLCVWIFFSSLRKWGEEIDKQAAAEEPVYIISWRCPDCGEFPSMVQPEASATLVCPGCDQVGGMVRRIKPEDVAEFRDFNRELLEH